MRSRGSFDLLFEALFKFSDRLRTVHTRHGQGAAYMALGAALATGKAAAYAVVPGPGLLNSAAALLTAYPWMRRACLDRAIPTPISAKASATLTRSAINPASSSGWSTLRADPQAGRLRARPPLRCGLCAPGGLARRRSNAQSTSG